MKSIVREGYEGIDYERAFRPGAEMTPLETGFLVYLCGMLPSGARVLDLGCGPGVPYGLFVTRRGHDLTGIDFCRKHLARARRHMPGARLICGDVGELPLPEASFDAVLSLYTIFHLPREQHGEMLRRIHRTLRPGGVCLLTFGTSDSAFGVEADWLGRKMAWSSYRPSVYGDLLGEAGLEILRSEFEGGPEEEEYHWWVLAKKR